MARKVLFQLLFAGILLSGCAGKFNIITMKTAHNRYLGREVTVVGRIGQTMDDLDSEFDYYVVADPSGEIWVLTKRGVPLRGTAFEIQGIFKQRPVHVPEQLGQYVIEELARSEWDILVDEYGFETLAPRDPV